jgi:putative aldouronate transport system substrate-binding protein
MKHRVIKSMMATMALILLLGVLAGCSGANESNGANVSNDKAPDNTQNAPADNSSENATGIDTSEKVELQFYMVGDAPKDLDVIVAEINKMALEDLNATVKFNYTTWTDYEQKYKLLLTSGQPIDLIYTANWLQYQTYSKKGAFLALDDLLPKVAPKLLEHVEQDRWDGIKVDGKIYTVPSNFKEYVTDGIAYREDLRKKYDLPIPETLETLEAYLDGIKKNEPELTPVSDTQNGYVSGLYQLLPSVKGNIAAEYGMQVPYDQPREMNSYWGSPEHLELLKVYKRFADKGFWSKNQLNATAGGHDVFASGKAAVALGGENPNRYNDSYLKISSVQPDWELGYFPYPNFRGYASPSSPMQNGYAIPMSSKNPERALAFYEKLVTDERYNLLSSYGIKGTHYEVEDGYYKMIGDSSSNGFPREAMNSWAWRNPDYMLFDKSFDTVLNLFSELDKMMKPDYYTGFAEDYTSYQAERAALEQVETQYLKPLEAGVVEDVEAGLALFMEKAKTAGIEKIHEEYKKQWLQYVDEIGK